MSVTAGERVFRRIRAPVYKCRLVYSLAHHTGAYFSPRPINMWWKTVRESSQFSRIPTLQPASPGRTCKRHGGRRHSVENISCSSDCNNLIGSDNRESIRHLSDGFSKGSTAINIMRKEYKGRRLKSMDKWQFSHAFFGRIALLHS